MGTPALPIKFDNQNGSDSTASGCGPSSVVSGTGNVQNVPFGSGGQIVGATNTSGLAAGQIVYVPTAAPKFNLITSVSANTINVEQQYTLQPFGANYYVGGERQTISNTDSRRLFAEDVTGDGWNIEIEDTGVQYEIDAFGGPIDLKYEKHIQGTNGMPEVVAATGNTTQELFSADSSQSSVRFYFEGIGFDSKDFRELDGNDPPNSAGLALFEDIYAKDLVFSSCDFGYAYDKKCSRYIQPMNTRLTLLACRFNSAETIAVFNYGDKDIHVQSCFFQGRNDNTAHFGLFGGQSTTPIFTVVGCVFADFRMTTQSGDTYGFWPVNNNASIVNNIFYNCYIGVLTDVYTVCTGNLFHSCSKAIDGTESAMTQGNFFYNNFANTDFTPHDSYTSTANHEFTSDPLEDPANNDFALSSAGASEIASVFPYGTAGQNEGSPPAPYNSMRSFDSTTAGSSGGIFKVTMNGGMDG